MTLKQQLTEDMKTAMKGHDTVSLNAIRFLQAEVRNVEIDHGEQDDAGVQKIIARQIKQMRDAISDYQKGGRTDLVEQEEAKIAVLERYLPKQLTDDELRVIIQQVKADNPSANQGQLIGLVLKQTAGRADGNRVSQLLNA